MECLHFFFDNRPKRSDFNVQTSDRCVPEMRVALTEIAEINHGYSFRGRVEADPQGDVLVIQAKDLAEDGSIDLAQAIRKSDVPIRSSFLLYPGDVLFQPRGVTYRPALVADLAWPAIAAAPVYVLRPDPEKVRAAYLVSFLSDPQTQALLRQSATGTHVPQVPRGAIESLEIPLPSLADQIALGELARLINRKKKIEDALNARMVILARALASERARSQQSSTNLCPAGSPEQIRRVPRTAKSR
jgi:hypothetical protein